MRNLFKQNTLKLLSFVLAVSVLFSMLSITMGSAAENSGGGDNQTADVTPADSGIDFDLRLENGAAYDNNGWSKSAVIVNATVRDYGNISDVYYKKSSCDNETDWVAVNNETPGSSLATTDEVEGKATFSFKIPSDTYSGSYDIRFKNAANISSSDFIVKKGVFSVQQDNIPPEIKIESYTKGWTNCATIEGKVSDKDSGIKSIEYSLDSGRNYKSLEINNGSFSFNITNDFFGVVWFLVTDNAENIRRTFIPKTEDQLCLTVDTKAPVISKIDPEEIKWTNNSVEITVQASDGSSRVSGVKEVHYCKVENNSEPLINPETDPKADFNSEDSKYTFTLNKDKDENFVGNVIIYAIDNAGNNSFDNDIQTLSVNFDTQQCVVTSISVDKTDWTNEEINLKVKIEDTLSGVKTDSVEYKVYPVNSSDSDGNWKKAKEKEGEPGTFTAVINEDKSLESGKYEIAVKAEDNAGNGSTIDETKAEVKYPLSVFIDNTAPIFNDDVRVLLDNGNEQKENEYTKSKIKITGTITDEHSGLKKENVFFRNENDTDDNLTEVTSLIYDEDNKCYTYTAEVDAQTYTGKFVFKCTDNAGNPSEGEFRTPDVYMDATPAEFDESSIKAEPSDWSKSTVISGKLTDSDSGIKDVYYKKSSDSDDEWISVYDNCTLTLSEDGKSAEFSIEIKNENYEGTYVLKSEDNAVNQNDQKGNFSVFKNQIAVKLDNVPPTVDDVEVEFKDGKGNGNTNRWTNDNIEFTVNASDKNGAANSGVEEIKYSFSDNKKYLQDESVKVNEDGKFTFTIKAEDLSIDKGKDGGYAGKILVYAVDKAGNISAEQGSKRIDIKIDTEKGKAEIVKMLPDGWQKDSVSVEVNFVDINDKKPEYISGFSKIEYMKKDSVGTVVQDWTELSKQSDSNNYYNSEGDKYTLTFEKTNFNGTYYVRFVDKAGNISNEISFNAEQDKEDPEIESATVKNTNWTNGKVEIEVKAKDIKADPLNYNSGIKSISFKKSTDDDTNWTEITNIVANETKKTAQFTIELPEQNYYGKYDIKCTDNADNDSTVFTTTEVKQDIIAPVLTVDNENMGNNDWTKELVTFTGAVSDNLSGVKAVEYRHIYSDGTKEAWQPAEYATNDDGLYGEFEFTLKPQNFSGDIEIRCVDKAGNNDYKSEDEITKRWVNMDTTAPEFEVKIGKPLNVWENLLSALTFGYYNNYNDTDQGNLTVILTAVDDNPNGAKYGSASGIKEFQYVDCNGTHKVDKSENGKEFTIKAPLNSDIRFIVIDNANNETEKGKADNTFAKDNTKENYIVDNIAPDKQVIYSTPDKTVNKGTLEDVQEFNTVTGNNDTDKNLYYNDYAEIRLRIKELNFYGEDINNETNGLKLNNVKNCKVSVDKNGNPWTVGNLVWHSEKDDWNYTDLTFEEEGEYVVTMDYMDRSMNKMAQFKSATIIVDKTAPKLSVSYSNKDVKNTINGVKYFDNTQTATITITEKNFRADDVNVKVTAKNSSGNDVSVTDYASYLKNRSSWKTVGDVHTATITYDKDSNYTFDIEYQDLAKNSIADYSEDRFTVDKTAPQSVNISYSQSVFAKVVNAISFNYYNAPVTVDLSCYDETSGVYSFDYEGIIAADASAVNKAVVKTAIDNAQITSANGTYTARFTIPQSALTALNSFNGTLTVDATDCSGNSIQNEDSRRIVADNIAPTGSVELNTPSGTSGNVSYYSGNITGTFTINEANFYPEDVDFRIDGSVQSLSWSNNGDTHTASFTISSEGEHGFTLNYADRSGNKMNAITRNNLVIDKTIPSIVVDKSIKNTSANNAKTITFKLSVDDKYFDASGINAKLVANVTKASDENPDEKISKLVEEEIDLGSPAKVGTTYVYTIENVSTDGFYTLTCTARDYAGNENSKISCTGSDDKTENVDGFNFSVNRNGSSFWVESSVNNEAYTNSDKISVALHEINVDEIASGAVLRIINDNETESVALSDKNYTKNKKVGKTGWYESVYSLDNSYFEKDSEYSVTLTTHDRAGNISMNTDYEFALVNFTVDRTAPVISSNIYNGQTIEAENYEVVLKIAENNLDKSSLKVFVGGESVEWKEDADNNSYSFNVEEKGLDEYTIVVEAKDLANNASEKYTVTGVRITNNKFILLILNPWFWIAVCVILAGIGITVFIVISKKRKREKEA